MQILSITLYRLIEHLDGEKGLKLIPYRLAEYLKVRLYQSI